MGFLASKIGTVLALSLTLAGGGGSRLPRDRGEYRRDITPMVTQALGGVL